MTLRLAMMAGGAGIVTSLALAALWQAERASHARTDANLQAAIRDAEVLRQRSDGLSRSLERADRLLSRQQALTMEMKREYEANQFRLDRARADLLRLERDEARRALQAPRARGDAAAMRWSKRMCALFAAYGDCSDAGTDADLGESRAAGADGSF